MMYRQHFWHGNGIVRGTAISGIDIALWDILGKIHGVPCHKLWGGPVRDYIRTYCHLGGGKMEDFYDVDPADAARFGELAARAVADGFTAFKSMAVPADDADRRPAAGALCRSLRARDARGGRRRHRHHGRLPCPAVAAHGPDVGQGPRAVRPVLVRRTVLARERRRPGRDSTGRGHADRHRRAAGRASMPFASLLEQRACSVIQPDITHCGGLSEARRIAAMAEAYRMALAPHNPQGPVSTAASLEFGFATPSYIICEAVHRDVPWRQDVVREGFTVEPKGRIVRPSQRPGLGIEINEAEVKKHPFQQEIVLREFYADGSVGDW